jgi:ferredoxin/flavodoxin
LKVHTVWAAYFSATGTTKNVVTTIAKRIAQQTGVPMKQFDFTLPSARSQVKAFSEGDLVIFGTPVYAGRVPNLLIKYIATVEGHGAMGVPVVLYGNRSFDDALMELRNTMEDGGFRTVAGGAFIGEHSFSNTMAAGRPDRSDRTIAKGFADQIVWKTAKIESFADHVPVFVKGHDPIRPYFRPTDQDGNFIDIRKVKPETSDACTDCKWCANHCPMGSIPFDHVKETTGICIKCNACVKGCPVNAKFFTDPKYLYHSQDIVARYSHPRKEPEYFL